MTLQLVSPSAYFCFAPFWADKIGFSRRYQTVIMTSITGTAEQRSALLTKCRRGISYTVRTSTFTQQSYLRRYLKNYRHLVWGVPIWLYEMRLTATEGVGSTVLNVDSTDYIELANGDKIILVANHSTYEVATIESFTGTTITITSGLSSEWASGKKLYPMLNAELKATQFPITPLTPSHIDTEVNFSESLRCEDA